MLSYWLDIMLVAAHMVEFASTDVFLHFSSKLGTADYVTI